jgi:uncharacterized protein (DUF305 family)
MKHSWQVAIFLFWILIVAMPAQPLISRSSPDDVTSSPDWIEFSADMQKMHGAMAAVAVSGNSDLNFVRLMLPHHEAAIAMARTQLLYGKDPQMRRLAQEIVTDQESEIELMQLWLKHHPTGSARPNQTPVLPSGKEH